MVQLTHVNRVGTSDPKGQIQDLLGPQKAFICSYNGRLGTPWGAPKVWKWVSDAYPINMGQLDHHVVFGTTSGAIQDFQRGKKCHIGVEQTPLDSPRPPKIPPDPHKTPLDPIIDPPYNQLNPSSYLINHKHHQNPN